MPPEAALHPAYPSRAELAAESAADRAAAHDEEQAATMRAILNRAAIELEALDFRVGSPVPGFEMREIVEFLRTDAMPARAPRQHQLAATMRDPLLLAAAFERIGADLDAFVAALTRDQAAEWNGNPWLGFDGAEIALQIREIVRRGAA